MLLIFVLLAGCGSNPLPPPPDSPSPAVVAPAVPPPTLKQTRTRPRPSTVPAQPGNTHQVATAPVDNLPNSTAPAVAQEPAGPQTIGTAVNGPEAAGNFIMALCRDLDGNLWIGTEDKGVLRGTPDGKWTQFTTKDGLGDDNGYALCCDHVGRIWAGQLNHGVAVFNGRKWRTYDLVDGPLGERTFDIACCPTNGDVWMATSHGLSRYSTETDRWSYITRADGLPSDQSNSLAFDTAGNVYVGTQCDGLAIARANESYAKWQVISGEISDTKYRQPQGTGLPSPLINDVLVARDGAIYVATALGLAKSKNGGTSWEYMRGRDYADKVKGRAEPPPKTWNAAPKNVLDRLLPEDFATCLAEDSTGNIYLAFRQQGFMKVDPRNDTIQHFPPTKDVSTHDWVRCLTFNTDGSIWIGGYGSGLGRRDDSGKSVTTPKQTTDRRASTAGDVEHPLSAALPTRGDLEALLARIKSNEEKPAESWGIVLNEDWATRGDWFGRLGRQHAILCAAGSPLDHGITIGDMETHYLIKGFTGSHGEKGESLRRWIHWMRSDERRVLYNPTIGYRREAEWDDHGEVYPMSHEGPDLWISVEVPRGIHRLSLYFVNPNGHEGPNRFRDYVLELKPHSNGDIRMAERAKPLARARVQDFWGGVYKQFAVSGPSKYWVKVDRSSSFNTIISGIFWEQMVGPPWPNENMARPWMGNVNWEPPKMPGDWDDEDASDEVRKVAELKTAADAAWNSKRTAPWQRLFHLLAYRAIRADQSTPKEVIQNWRWHLRVWSDKERKEFDKFMAIAWIRMCEMNPGLAEAKP